MLGIMKILHTPKQHQQFEVAGKRHGAAGMPGREVGAAEGRGCDGLGAAAFLPQKGARHTDSVFLFACGEIRERWLRKDSCKDMEKIYYLCRKKNKIGLNMKEIINSYLYELSQLKESEDHIEFKEAKRNFNWDGGDHKDPKERRHCILGYVAALANERGGRLVFGMKDHLPHEVVGTVFEMGKLGALEDAIYERMRIRVHIEEVFEPSAEAEERKRVIIFHVPSRPVGKMLKFEGVPLMRTGESLREMYDEEMFKILSEQEPVFSAKPCNGLTMDDLDSEAIRVMKHKYAEKNDNPGFAGIPDEQALKDLELLEDGKLNYAALVLLGKSKAIKKYLPQNNVVIEYRKDPASIPYDVRFGDGLKVSGKIIDGLVSEGLLLRSKNGKLSMPKEYKKIATEFISKDGINGDVNGPVNSLRGSLKEVYLIVLNHPGIKIKQVAEIRGKTESTVWKQLTDLKKKSLIEYRGSDKNGGYYAKEEMMIQG